MSESNGKPSNRKSRGRRVAAIIVFIIFGGFGLMMLGVGVKQHFEQKRLLANARSVEVEIIQSEVFVSTSRDTDRGSSSSTSTTTYRPDLKFRYLVGGVKYESDRLYPTIIVRSFASRESAAEVLKPFPVGAKVKAFVDDTQPDKAFLIAQAGAGPIVFIIIGVLLPPVAWAVGRYLI